jgi:hypothetical protein
MIYRNVLSTLFFIIILSFVARADDDEVDVRDLPIRERIFVGGNLGLQISNINTSVVISPMVGFRFTNRFSSGMNLTYQYYRDRGWGNLAGFTSVTHIYGGSVFVRYRVTRQFFAHAEYEALNLDSQMAWQLNTPGSEGRFWEQNYFLGGGYRAPLGARANLNLMLLYNFNNSSVVYFQNPIFRLGVDVRL